MSSVLESSLLLRQCGDSRDLSRGREIHRQLVQSGEDRQTFLGNLIILMYGKCGRTEEAIQAFHRIRQANSYSWTNLITALARNSDLDRARWALHSMPGIEIVAWNTLITAYAQQGHPQRALRLFEIMDLEGIVGDGITLLGAIEACAQLQSLSRGRQIHARIASLGLDRSELPLANALIKMYSRCASVNEAKGVFDGMIHRDLVSWNTIVAAFATNGHLDRALEAFYQMDQRDRASWNTMIMAFSQLGDHRRSIYFLASMDLEGIEPDDITFLGGLEACAGLTAIAEGKLLHSSIRQWGLESRLQISTSLITMYGKCGDPALARCIFDNRKIRDSILWNAMVAAYAQNGHLEKALDLFWQMDLEGIAKSSATHVNLLAGLSHGGTLRDGIEFFLAMIADHSVEPGYKHYSCVIDLLARTGKLGDAHDLLLAMPFHPDVISWTTVLAACKLHRDSERAAAIAQVIGSSHNAVVSIANFSVHDT